MGGTDLCSFHNNYMNISKIGGVSYTWTETKHQRLAGASLGSTCRKQFLFWKRSLWFTPKTLFSGRWQTILLRFLKEGIWAYFRVLSFWTTTGSFHRYPMLRSMRQYLKIRTGATLMAIARFIIQKEYFTGMPLLQVGVVEPGSNDGSR